MGAPLDDQAQSAATAPRFALGREWDVLERLESELGTDGLWHARYPSATRTLCGSETRADGSSTVSARLPSCVECSRVAVRWDRVDGSMPAHWRVAA